MDDTDLERDPSFLAARVPSIEPWKKPITVYPKNLCNSAWSLVNGDQYKVFLRIKPSTTENNTQVVLDNNTLLTTVPKGSVTYKGLSSSNSLNLQRKFGFTSILDDTATQHDVFQECVLPPLKSFLQGEDCLLMAFGTTSAGKTYTMQGTSKQPGMIPRALTFIFRHLEDNLEGMGTLQPFRGTQLSLLTPTDVVQERSFKNKILYLDLAKYQKSTDTSHMSFKSFSNEEEFKSSHFEEIQNQIGIADNESIILETTDQFSVWMSMIEIYNETILDLLQFPNEKGARPSLCLGEDERGAFYVKNVKQIHVRNGHEAYQICQFGRTNLHRAPTALNDKSSRSHCILTLTLVRHGKDFSSCHRFSFVDLAGSERVKKTLNEGKRLVESKSINKSLSVLGKCLQALKINQSGRANQIVPVRDSKLTKLFKNALFGVEKLTFLINISTDPFIFDETLHVLKFSALAQEILAKAPPSKTRFSQIFHGNREALYAWSAFPSVSDLTDKSEDNVDRSKKPLEDADRRIRELERKIRAQKEEIEELEKNYNESEERAEGLKALLLEERAHLKSVQFNLNEHLRNVMANKNREKEENLTRLKKNLTREKDEIKDYLEQRIKALMAQNEKLKEKMKSMVEPDEAYDAAYQKLLEENKKLRCDKKDLKELLNEAAEDYTNALEENTQLKKTLEEQAVTAEDSEYYETQIEELSAALAETQEKLKSTQDECDRLEAVIENKLCIDEDKTILQDLKKENQEKDEKIAKLEVQMQELENEILFKTEETEKIQQDLQKMIGDLDEAQIRETDFKVLEDKLKTLEEKYREVISERDDLKNQILHEKSVVEFLENETQILRNTIKQTCTQEEKLIKEIEALKAAIRALEKEVSMKASSAHEDLLKRIATISEEKAALEKCFISARDEIQHVKDESNAKESAYVNNLKSMEADLAATRKKLEIAEYQKKVAETLKEKSEHELKSVPELKETIERLENELINKDQEFVAFENSRKFLIAQNENELEKYRAEIERLKKEVEFGRDVMLENLKSSAKKDEVKSLQDQLTNMKLTLRENFNERSPLRNRTNIMVPVGNLVEISPYHKFPFVKCQLDGDAQPRLSRIFSSLDNLTALAQMTPIKELKRLSNSPVLKNKTPKKLKTPKIPESADQPVVTRSARGRRKSCSPNSANIENLSSPIVKRQLIEDNEPLSRMFSSLDNLTVTHKTPVKDENQERHSLSSSPVEKSKTKRKPRTAKKRDPTDHPALSKSTRGRRKSVSPPPPVLSSRKKKLFSCEDFVELSGEDNSPQVLTSPGKKRVLRPRTRKN